MLSGKIALVTGGARGIGKAIAKKLAEQGAFVIVNYAGSVDRANQTVEEIKSAGGDGVAIQCDVSDFAACGELAAKVLADYGRLDILVNNAGITKDNLIMKMSEQDYDAVLNTNLKGSFNLIHHFSRSFLKQRSGKIINISSVSGVMGNAGQANYSASKAGLIGLTKSVARELASRGICVNAVAPGFIETDMTEKMPDSAKQAALGMIPLGKMGKPEDIAQVVAFLADESGDYITGQVICVDGGMAI
ncbi:MAG: 3-oxoacyl-[acyl-carrier-protein] reductase [Lachnospiraceae bacterium]|nr:3-oxoacyl-[acyl-carrier-protein] reductase [Lachnospiraceae bacterium]